MNEAHGDKNGRTKMNRRDAMKAGTIVAGAAAMLGAGRARAGAPEGSRWSASYSGGAEREPMEPGLPDRDYRPVVVPNGATLPFKIVDGVKVFHLIVEEIDHEFAPGLRATCWGYNGLVNGTVIEAVEGERVRFYVTNKLTVPTTIHWHGLYLPNGMDGVSGLTQRPIPPGETFKYEWTLRQHGTFMYHSHHDAMTQEAMGLTGMFVVHPRSPGADDRVDRDFVLLTSEWRIDPGTSRPNTLEMLEFNVLTFNGRSFPGTDALVAKKGDRVRIRLGNLSIMDHHPIHLHGYHFKITATDGSQIPASAQWPETTVVLGVGQTRDLEFIADEPGDWPMHCHMTHHMMNQMGHKFPNMLGIDPTTLDARVQPLLPGYMTMGHDGMGGHGEHIAMGHMNVPENSIPMVGGPGPFSYIDMGGMFTILKVREGISSYEDPGWYEHPAGTVAEAASADEMRRDLG